MKYSEDDLFKFMDSEKTVSVVSDDGKEFQGRCWAYSAIQNKEESNIAEPSLDVGPGTILYASEISSITVLN